MRSICIYAVVSVAVSFTVMADPVPVDPHILIDTGGDAIDINYTGLPITIGPNGGGIFVFHNATENPLTEVDVDVDFQVASLPVGFTVDGTIPVPPSLVRQYPTFDVSTFSGFNCSGAASDDDSCVEMRFILTPGPLVPVDGNFVLDFNNTDSYTAEDLEILNGTYTGGDDPNGTGGWAPGGAGTIQPAAVVPEPSYRATAGIMGLALLAAWNYRRRLTAKKS
jgi:hypothetical protein